MINIIKKYPDGIEKYIFSSKRNRIVDKKLKSLSTDKETGVTFNKTASRKIKSKKGF